MKNRFLFTYLSNHPIKLTMQFLDSAPLVLVETLPIVVHIGSGESQKNILNCESGGF